jgi:hypothetical protein
LGFFLQLCRYPINTFFAITANDIASTQLDSLRLYHWKALPTLSLFSEFRCQTSRLGKESFLQLIQTRRWQPIFSC